MGHPPSANSILESITDAFTALDEEFRYVWVNAEAERLLAIPRTELLGRCIWDVFPSIAGSIVEEKCREAATARKPVEFEHFFPAWGRWFFDKVYPNPNGGIAIYWREITDQKKAEAKLRRQAMELEQVHDSIVATDLEGKITRWNHGAEKIFGYEAREVLGQDVRMLYFGEDRTAALPFLAGRESNQTASRVRHKSGAERFMHFSYSQMCDEVSVPYGWLAVAIDITAQQKAEQALRVAEERFRLASQAVEGIVYDWNPKTGLVHRSGDLQKLIGVPAEQAEPSETWWQSRVHPEDGAQSSFNLLARLAEGQDHFDAEFRFRHASGRWIYLCDHCFVVRGENGDVRRVVGSTHDITARKLLEEALKESNRKLRFQADILESTNDAVIALDPDLCIRYCNAAAEQMYGVKLKDVLGQPLPAMHGYAWLDPKDERRFFADWAERGSWKGEYIHVLKDGTQLVVQSTVNKLAPEAGGGMVAVIRDITGQKQAELRTQNQGAQLARANDDLLHFAYAVSHDLQAPLRTITSFSQLLALKCRQSLDDRGNQFIGWIVDASTRMHAMLHDLLQFAKTAGAEAVLEQVALELALATALDSLRSGVEETQAVITRDELPEVAADSGQIVQLLQNLIGNALKYRQPTVPPRIHVGARRTETEWVISVQDNGIGFDPNDAERIFGVFQRLHRQEFAGTGIGLTICKRIVERRGGRIWAEGVIGVGATFHFTIPDSTAVVQANPPIDWQRVPGALEGGPARDDLPSPAGGHFDELFKAFDLAQAVVRGMDGSVLIWTKGAERLFGWTEVEARGKPLHDLIGTEFQIPRARMAADLLRSGEWAGELKARKKDGRVVWLASHMVLYRDGSGRPESVIEVYNDITGLKKLEDSP